MAILSIDFINLDDHFKVTKDSYHKGVYNIDALSPLGYDSFIVSIEKEDGYWVIYSEEHCQDEIYLSEDVPNKFKTLKEAKIAAVEWSRDFYECFIERMIENDPED